MKNLRLPSHFPLRRRPPRRPCWLGGPICITEFEQEAISKWLREEEVQVSLTEFLVLPIAFGENDDDKWDLPEVCVTLSLGQPGEKRHVIQSGGCWGLL